MRVFNIVKESLLRLYGTSSLLVVLNKRQEVSFQRKNDTYF